MKLMVIPVGRSLVFTGSQVKNISYSTDHRHKIFRTLPRTLSITGTKYFVLYRSQAKNTYSTEKIFRSLPPGGRSQTPGFFRITLKKYLHRATLWVLFRNKCIVALVAVVAVGMWATLFALSIMSTAIRLRQRVGDEI